MAKISEINPRGGYKIITSDIFLSPLAAPKKLLLSFSQNRGGHRDLEKKNHSILTLRAGASDRGQKARKCEDKSKGCFMYCEIAKVQRVIRMFKYY